MARMRKCILEWISTWLKNESLNHSLFSKNSNFNLNWNNMETILKIQKQPPRGILRKRFSENMQQIYRRTTLPKCDFNKVAKQLYWNRTSAWVFSCKLAAYFQKNFSSEHLLMAASENTWKIMKVIIDKSKACNDNFQKV